ncbi:hypothetical protein [Nocardia exalbida]|uniref:hypothetical protein n=1 Tax=Nocardia exalbida TaxID=290231 RepID=UPI0012F655A0|nr:hypothetical protein [Nocardia exalbida]
MLGLAGTHAWNIADHDFLVRPPPGLHFLGDDSTGAPIMIRTDTVIKRLVKDTPVQGLLCSSPAPALVGMIGCAGYDFVVIDTEHTLLDLERGETDGILTGGGIDVLLPGPADLCYGVPWELRQPLVTSAVDRLHAACIAYRIRSAPQCGPPNGPCTGVTPGSAQFSCGDTSVLAATALRRGLTDLRG